MKVCIYGLGAIGGLLAARLALSGIQVSAVARGRTLQAVRERGLVLEADGSRRSAAIRVVQRAHDLGPQDLVVVALKTTALPDAAADIAGLLAPGGVLLSAMNGVPWWFFHGLPQAPRGLRLEAVDPGGAVSAALAPERVIGAVVHLSAQAPEPAVVRAVAGKRLVIGEARGADSERVRRVQALLTAAGFDVEATPCIQQEVWFKLWGNLTMNPVSALTGATGDRILDDQLVRGFLSRCMAEAAAVGARIGLPIAMEPEERHAVTRQLGAFRTSMLQDLDAGRPLELDALVAAVRELAVAVQVPTPEIDTLFGLARLQARVRGLYPA